MDSSNLGSVPEETLEEQLHQQQQESKPVVSAFASVPDRPPTQGFSQNYSPLDWSGYFDREEDICIPDSNDVFHLYMTGTEGPVIFCLHGGGYSGLSFALSASKIKEKARIVAMDLRGHGKSSTENDLDLSIETMCNDVFAVLKALYGDSPPAIVLVGHSMGGSVAVHVAAKKTLRSLAGLVVVDVVEGTAMASLMHMQKILSNRMQHFSSIEKAIEWSVRGGSLRNIDSARVSIPTTLKYDDSKKCYVYRARLEETEQYWRGWYSSLKNLNAKVFLEVGLQAMKHRYAVYPCWLVSDTNLDTTIGDEGLQAMEHECQRILGSRITSFLHRCPGLYEGLSEKFLSCPVPKLLLLAGTDRLDRALTIGQMQGKFQMVVVRHTGHAIQEDAPDEFAMLILNFISRNRIGPHGVELYYVADPRTLSAGAATILNQLSDSHDESAEQIQWHWL
ncbi:hypothetical protein QUC31_001328 [Theobroma cacao]